MRKLTALSFAMSVSLFSGTALSAEYHVTTTGNDQSDGSTSAPWGTLQHGVDSLSPGDTLVVHEGTYLIDTKVLVDQKKGTQAQPFVLRAEGQVTLKDSRSELADWAGLIDVRNSSWVTISGFRLDQPRFFGIFFQGCDHVTAENNFTSESRASGVASWTSTNVTIRNNDIRAMCNEGSSVPSKWGTNMGCQEGISLDTTVGFLIEGNVVHDAQQSGNAHWGGGEGIDVKNGSSNGKVVGNEVFNVVQLGIYVDAWENDITNIEIYRNHVHHNANGIIITSEQTGDVDGVQVHDNLVHDIGFNGVSVSHYEVAPNVIANVHVFNNTLAHIGYPENKPYFLPDEQKNAIWGDGISVGKPDVVAVVIRDNLIWDIGGGEPVATADGLSGHTIEGNVTEDPLFLDFAKRDLRTGPGSPAIDKGTGTRSPDEVDYWGNGRVAGARVDVGAFEYGSSPASGGSAGSGGSASPDAGKGGSAGAVNDAGMAGSSVSGFAGSVADGAAGNDGAGEDSGSDGCSCSLAATGASAQLHLWLSAIGALLLVLRKRR